MVKKILTVLLTFALVATSVFANGEKEAAGPMQVKNPDTFVYGTIGEPATLDPAVAYDSSSGDVMTNVMETLVTWDRDTGVIIPALAEELPTMENGGISADGMTYRFKVRKGVKFHQGGELTPEDVAYSIQRNMVVDVDHGPQWMHWMVFFGENTGLNDDGSHKFSVEEIQSKIFVDGDEVVFKLAHPSPFFLAIMTGYWSMILDKEWCMEQGGWDGTPADRERVFNPPTGEELLFDINNGTGPYKLARWVKGEEVVLERNEEYWGDKPAIANAIYKKVDEWSTRKLMFLQGDLDYAYIEPVYWDEMEKEEGLVWYDKLPRITITGLMFQQAINNVDNPLTFSGQLDGQGVPSDFFADKDVRLGFMYAWNEDVFLNDIGNGAYRDPVGPIPYGLQFKDGDVKRLPNDLAKAEEHFKKAFGGQVWEKGFKVELTYNEGNEVRGGAMRMLAEAVNSLNDKFDISVRSVPWAEFLDANKARRLPIFSIGWAPDYPDPDNFVDPFMFSEGYFASRGSYSNPEVDELVLKGRYATDDATRAEVYKRLEEIYVEDAVGLCYGQAIDRHWTRDWINWKGGFYFQPENDQLFNRLRDLIKEQ